MVKGPKCCSLMGYDPRMQEIEQDHGDVLRASSQVQDINSATQ